MMLTAGMDADEGKSNFGPPETPDVVGSGAIVGPALTLVGGAIADNPKPPPCQAAA
jgi:hypothetical protein